MYFNCNNRPFINIVLYYSLELFLVFFFFKIVLIMKSVILRNCIASQETNDLLLIQPKQSQSCIFKDCNLKR
jgi:hypothetical protein